MKCKIKVKGNGQECPFHTRKNQDHPSNEKTGVGVWVRLDGWGALQGWG